MIEAPHEGEEIIQDPVILSPPSLADIQAYADKWLARMQSALGEAHITPAIELRLYPYEEMGEVIGEWWGKGDKKLTIIISENEERKGSITADYIRLWDGVNGPMYDGCAEDPDVFRLLWQWLWA